MFAALVAFDGDPTKDITAALLRVNFVMKNGVIDKKQMTLAEFESAIAAGAEPKMAPALLALWHDARGNWDRAHAIAQDLDDDSGSLVHAYLHRKEGDLANAGYWYRRAHRPIANDSLDTEWARIATELLGRT